MKKIAQDIINFLEKQNFVIVSTIDQNGSPHSACKDIVSIEEGGRIYLLDLYLKQTYDNLRNNPNISITAVEEHKFKGYCLKGKANIVKPEELPQAILKAWEARITARITQRMIKNLREEKGQVSHPEARFPKPRYLILAEIDKIVDLTPRNLAI